MKPSHTQLSLYGSNRFHNTVRETDEKLLQGYEASAKALEDRILEHMQANQGERPQKIDGVWTGKIISGWTAAEIKELKAMEFTLLTSIRRALDNLAKDEYNPKGTVYRTGEKRDGGYGIRTIVWKFREATNVKP